MSLYDKASIALIPSGTKASKLYSVLPANGDGDFTHSRGSTATRVNKDGLIETVAANVARLNYPITNGVVGDCPHLLLEPQRTNSLTYSTLAFNGGATPTGWSVGFGTGTFSHTETTYKGQGAVKHTQSTTGRSYLSETISLLASTTYTLRVEFDRDNSSGIDDTDYIVATANMDNIITKQWADVDDDGILEVQFTTGTDATGELRLGFGVSGNEDGGKTIVFSMPQIEQGSYATSYIPTSGSTATRSADICNNSGTSADINSEEGVLFAELATLDKDDTSSRRISISDSTTNNVIRLTFDVASNRLYAVVYKSGTIWATYTTLSNSEDFNKVALKYKPSDFDFYVNGVKVQQQSSGATFDAGTMSEVAFDNGSGGNLFYGKIKQLIVFNEALSDSELETLTS